MIEIVSFIVLGGLTGILSGLLGFGGGIFVVPCLYFLFTYLQFPEDYLMHLVIGTSLATMISTSIAATWSHHKRKAVIWSTTKKLAICLIIGSVIGAFLAEYIPSHILSRIFGVFAILFSVFFLIPKASFAIASPTLFAYSLTGSIIGFLSSLLGIGGGTVAVPLLVTFKMSVRNAIATSSSLTFITSVIGTIGYLIIGWNEKLFEHSFGFIYLPGFIWMSIATVLLAPVGVRLAHYLNPNILKILYAVTLGIIGLSMIFFG